MTTPLRIARVWNWSPQRFQVSTLQSWQSTAWRRVAAMSAGFAGDPGDEILWVVHGRLGNLDVEFADPSLRLTAGIRMRVSGHPDGRFETVWVNGPGTAYPMTVGAWRDCAQSFCFVVKAPNVPVEATESLVVEARCGAYGAAREVRFEVENLTAMAINLTAATSRGIAWFYDEDWTEYALGLAPQSINGNVAIPVLGGDRDLLILTCGRVNPGSGLKRYELEARWFDGLAYSKRVGPAGMRGYGLDGPNVGSFHRQFVGLGMHVRAGGTPGEAIGVYAKQRHAVSEPDTRTTTVGRSIFGIDVEALGGVIEGRESETYGLGPEWNTYGPFLNRPGVVQSTAPVIQGGAEVPTSRVGLFWTLPSNRHSPSIPLAFAGRVQIQDAQLAASSRATPLYVLHLQRGEGLPDYETFEFATGRGAWRLRKQGWQNPALDPLDASGNPTRVTSPRFPHTAQGVACCFLAIDGAQDTRQGPQPKGPPLYIVPGREAPDPATLPDWLYLPESQIDGEEIDRRGELRTFDGRRVTWGSAVQPRRSMSVRWTFNGHGHGLPERDRAKFVAWLHGLAPPMVRWDPDGLGEVGAWLVVGEEQIEDLGARVERLTLEVVELYWTEGGA